MATLRTLAHHSFGHQLLGHHSQVATWLMIWLLAILIVLVALAQVAGGALL